MGLPPCSLPPTLNRSLLAILLLLSAHLVLVSQPPACVLFPKIFADFFVKETEEHSWLNSLTPYSLKYKIIARNFFF